MTPEQRQRIIEILLSGGEVAPEWSRILFPPEKREYELVYQGKEREEDIIANTLAVPLQPVRTFNKNGVTWHNKLIFGDNLQAMKTLLEMKRRGELCNADGTSGIRLVYIDPPFATRQEFQGAQDQKAYQDKIYGATFIEFLRKRLILIRDLLSDNGLLYVHLDYRKSHYIKVILDEIFGEQNFMNEVAWCYGERELATRHWNRKHDNILVYAKNFKSDQHVFNWKEAAGQYSQGTLAKYEHIDEDGRKFQLRGRNVKGSPWRGKHGIPLDVEAANPEWVYRDYFDTKEGIRPRDWWSDIPFLNRASSDRYDYPSAKNPALLNRIIKVSSNIGDLVMDAFAGSGTTCAVAEKLNRRWIGIDCGKLAIYTIQKRMLNLSEKGKALKAKPFTLYNAGLYDFARLKELPWSDWRRFALTLFSCQSAPQRIGGIQFDGTLKASPVIIFDHRKGNGATVSEETLRSIHEAAGSKVGTRIFIIAPAMAFDFQQDYIQIGEVRYYALRVPYSIIHELHQRDFLALKQPTDEMAVNDTVDAVGFDFIKTPELEYAVGRGNPEGELLEQAFIRIDTFFSEAAVREPMRKRGNRETLSMVMLDYDYDAENDVFDLDEVFYAEAIEGAAWEVRFPANRPGEKVMAVFLDIYGNEARVVIPAAHFALEKLEKRNGSPIAKTEAKRA
ncbi:site-specific DNA-methyltransferase (adenine-specific)/adenine-specific DNA-methyltransferase [Nitrosospira multiformis ATCC 25196]|uniref:site-specific DNA-methyltransferase (adenine-specific) n=1 Tax=Nitrosospira multiformis (strain ATCC 25196 / NCIMB 11849 / C 71) TaxID=323848 RepID=Q2Y700_NITMU|nr:site-specific DNA-methyltransferase [Nitrosospira multiformis]ABB75471.1 Site-specific DNA-methyltransferase (adenine-specific) [Nitrosospira multiformis ATCC 25196]SEG02856.1 site-specific DNA-methyltransferase (adenine-specific)/adenine-specific DNA-methyltransferase [Nitrosospira multiformis ATCC 25196]